MIVIESHAKINWYLRILDRRPDGYHNLETVFQEIGLGDSLAFEATDSAECQIDGFPADVPAESNLITKAWELMRTEFPGKVRGLHVQAQKEIPRGGGLGGGSSNAAAALKAVNELFDLKLPASDLEMRGATLGSDVPFFIRGGCAIGRGRGERLTPVKHNLRCGLILLFPGVHVNTGEAYKKLSGIKRNSPDNGIESVLTALNTNDLNALCQATYNDFENTVVESKWFDEARAYLALAGCHRSFLCGSGSTVAGLVSEDGQNEKVLEYLHRTCAYQIKGCVIS